MIVSPREEALAMELYANGMGLHPDKFVPWNDQLETVQDSYRYQALKVVNSRWFREELALAALRARADL